MNIVQISSSPHCTALGFKQPPVFTLLPCLASCPAGGAEAPLPAGRVEGAHAGSTSGAEGEAGE